MTAPEPAPPLEVEDDFFEEPAPEPVLLSAAETESVAAPAVVTEAKEWRPMLSVYDGAPAPAVPMISAASTAGEAEPSASEAVSGSPVDLRADSLQHDEGTNTITAIGDVMMVQDGRILRADTVSYDLNTDTVMAAGHVVVNEPSGDIYYLDEVELTDNLKDGFVEGLEAYMADGSRFWADAGHRTGGTKTTMEDAIYTPCEPCKNDPDADPLWQIRAAEVTHDEEERRVSYKHARFEVYGTPVAYVPYFSHPDGSIKRKTGFLGPMAGYKSDFGAFVGESFYWGIAPDMDATFGVIAMTEEAPLFHTELRKRWANAELNMKGGLTYSDYEDQINGVGVPHEEEWRGHVVGNALWNMNEKWRSGVNVEWASDDQYARQYDFSEMGFSGDDVLENEVFAERFSGRNYAVARLLAFQDTRISERQEQPEVLPEIIASFKGEPGAVPLVKGNWNVDTSFLGLSRDGNGQDMNRFSTQASWKRRLVSDYGLLTKVETAIRGDLYNTRDRDVAALNAGQGSSTTETRVAGYANVQSSYPMVRQFEKMQATIEPIVGLTFLPNIDVNNNIPNEDSQDAQIDASNLFEPNRFPGLDRIEDSSKITYGLRTGLTGYEGSSVDVFVGQSYRFDDDSTPFPAGSGLDAQSSDVVGQIAANYKNKYSLNYRFQLASDTLSSQRHEIDAFADWDRLQLSSRYLFAKGLDGTNIDESREQLQAALGYYLSEDWRVSFGGTQDLGADPGLRKAYAGLDYFGQCVSFGLTAERNLTDDATGDSDTEILFRIGLKNLGEFASSALRDTRTTE